MNQLENQLETQQKKKKEEKE